MATATRHQHWAVPGVPRLGEWRQLAGLCRLEWRRYVSGNRVAAILILSSFPLLLVIVRITFIMAVGDDLFQETIQSDIKTVTTGEQTLFFAGMFQVFVLRFILYFACLYFFANLFRGDAAERTLHLYFLVPVRRSLLVTAKYAAAVAAAAGVMGAAVLVSGNLVFLPHGFREWVKHVILGGEWKSLGLYLCLILLACLAYGAVFLLCGLAFRNPMVAGVMFYFWEVVNIWLPPGLKAFSIIFYLNSLMPVRLMEKTPFAIIADPASPLRVVVTLCLVAAVCLALSMAVAARRQIDYGSEK